MIAHRIRTVFLLLLALCTAASAQDEERNRIYTIEIVVFARADAPPLSALAETVSEPEFWGTRLAQGPAPLLDGVSAPAVFTSLSEREFELGQAAARLAQNGMRKVLHTAWRQPMFSFRDGKRVRVNGSSDIIVQRYDSTGASARGVPELDGMVGLRLGRYVNLEMDFLLRRDSPNSADPETRGYDVFRLSQRRQIRIGETQYFDHEAFGVLARISRLDALAE